MSPFRIIAGILLLLLLVVLAMGLYLQFADLSRHKPTVESIVRDSTGREFHIDGDLKLSIWPMLKLVVEDLSLANAPWSAAPEMAKVGHFSAHLYPLSLISGPLRLEQIKLRDVQILAESDAEGRSNWTFENESEAAGHDPASSGQAVVLEQAELANILVTLRQPHAEDRLLRLDNLLMQPGDANMELVGSGEIFSRPLQLAGTLGPIDQLRSQGAVELKMQGSLGDLALALDGHVASLKTMESATLVARIDSDDISPLLQASGFTVPLTGPAHVELDLQQSGDSRELVAAAEVAGITSVTRIDLSGSRLALKQEVSPLRAVGALFDVDGLPELPLELSGTITPHKGHLEIHDLVANVGKAQFNASGQLATAGGSSTLALQVGTASLAELREGLPDIPLEASADARYSGRTLELDSLKILSGKSDVSGRLRHEGGDRTELNAELHSTLIDLGELFPQGADAQEATTEAPTDGDQYVFKEEPLPFELLQSMDAEMKWTIETLSRKDLQLRPLVLAGKLQGGTLTATLTTRGQQGGEARSQLELVTVKQSADLSADFAARGLRLNLASGDARPEDIPPNDITLELRSRGGTPRELARAASGSLLLTQGPGKINNTLVSKVSADIISELLSALNPLAKTEEFSNWECSLLLFEIGDGQAILEQLILQGEKVMIVGGGKIDLDSEQLNLEFNTKPRKGIGVSADMFVTPFVALKGTLASPALGLNEKGTLLTAGAAAATGGISLLVKAAVDRLGGSVDHCVKTLPDYPHPQYPQ